jgi:hypothetical protein
MTFYVETISTESKFKPVPIGSHLARCYRIIDLGTQKGEYNGQITIARKIMVGWELFGEDDEGLPLLTDKGDPMAVFKNYTHSWHEKANLRVDLQSWRGKPFDVKEMKRFNLESILGQYCMLNVIHRTGSTGKLYSNVQSISPVPNMIKQQGLPDPVNKDQIFKISDPDMELFETLGKATREKIEGSPEWKARGENVSKDSIPF